jgi:PEGA domain
MRSTVILLALLSFLLPRGARADQVGAGAIVISGKIGDREQSVAAAAAETSVRAAGWSLSPKPFSAKERDAVVSCLHDIVAWPCVSKLVGSRGVQRVAVLLMSRRVTDVGTPELVLNGRLVLSDAEMIAVGQRYCERCTDDTLRTLTIELFNELIQGAELDSGRTVLSVKSTPRGALYSLDGTLMGPTNALINILPGNHVITVDREGYESVTRTIQAVQGTTSEVDVTLKPASAASPPSLPGTARTAPPAATASSTTGGRSLVLPKTLVVVGSVAVLGGALAVVLSPRDVDKPRGQDQPSDHYETVIPGVTSIVAGAVTAGVGGYLWWKYTRDVKTAPVVAPVAGGGLTVGVRGTF